MGSTGSDEGQFDRQVDTLMFPTFDARRQRVEVTHGDGNTSIMELEAADEGGEDHLILEQREFHADADPGTFREGEQATPPAAHPVCRGNSMLSWCAVLCFCGITAADEPTCRAEDVSVAEDGLVAVDTERRNMDHLALLDRDRIDP